MIKAEELMWIIPIAAFIPLIMGFIWYNPKVFGKAWMESAGLSEEKLQGANMGIIFFLSYVFSCFMGLALLGITIHQLGLNSMVLGADEATVSLAEQLMDVAGRSYRTFGHGAFHGVILSIFFVLPLLATNALFERKGWKYIWINTGYWAICLIFMGGVICQFA